MSAHLHTCGRMGLARCTRIRFYFGVSAVVQTDGATPLYIASRNGHVEVVRALVGAGAAVNQADVRDDWGGSLCSGVRG